MDFDFVDELFHEHRGNRGRPLKYKPSSNLKAIIYGLAEDRRSICEIARLIDDIVARKCCGYGDDTPSHDTLSRFWNRLAAVIEEVFKHALREPDESQKGIEEILRRELGKMTKIERRKAGKSKKPGRKVAKKR